MKDGFNTELQKKEGVMTKWICWITVFLLMIGLGASAQAGSPMLSATPMVKMDKKATVSLVGSGFKPGQVLSIVITDRNGITANIGAYLDPKPVANSSGEFFTTWKSGRYISKKLVKDGVTVLKVMDDDYNLLAHASIAFVKGDVPPPGKVPLVSATQNIKMSKNAEATIIGSGYKPGQEISILITDRNGISSNIGAYVDPKSIVADNAGKWSATWKCGRYVSKKLVSKGITVIKIVDNDFNLLAHNSITFTK